MSSLREILIEFDNTPASTDEEHLKRFQEAEAKLLNMLNGVRDEAVIKHWHYSSTNNRPLSAPPLIKKQPVPCPRCKTEKYADWTLWPHQVYNSYMPGGTGHYCFPCFAKIVTEQLSTTEEDHKAKPEADYIVVKVPEDE